MNQQSLHADVSGRLRKMLAAELGVAETILADDFRWFDLIGSEDAELFLAEVNDAFTRIGTGLTFGSGEQPFPACISRDTVQQVGTVGGLIEYVERHANRNLR